ncbi:hypothetical protein [Fundidesulfovibrio soli]|uniref:hypothetical protein n=1 Tax=Fundidesulfovibrio soli TaxID=2922716 RepID=UPI001FAE8514|nr:hypothetical protein [Fundidesulfovibrio soli]
MLLVAPVVFTCAEEAEAWSGEAGRLALGRWFAGLGAGVVACADSWVGELAREHGLEVLDIAGADPSSDGDAPPGWGAALAGLRAPGGNFEDGAAVADFRYPHIPHGLLAQARQRLERGARDVLSTVRPCRDHPCQFQSHDDVLDAGILALFDPNATRLEGPAPCYTCLPVPAHGGGAFVASGTLDPAWLAGVVPPATGAALAGVSSTGGEGHPRLCLWRMEDGGLLAIPHGFTCGPDARASFLPVGEGGPTGNALEPPPEADGWRLPADRLPEGLRGFTYAVTGHSPGPAHDMLTWLEPSDGRWHFDHLRQVMVDGRTGASITGRQSFPELYELCRALRVARPGAVDRLARLGALTGCELLVLEWREARRVRCALDLEA